LVIFDFTENEAVFFPNLGEKRIGRRKLFPGEKIVFPVDLNATVEGSEALAEAC